MNHDDGDNDRGEMLDNRSAMQSLYEAQRQLDKLHAKLAAVTAERDRLAEALRKIVTSGNQHGEIYETLLAKEALADVKGGEP